MIRKRILKLFRKLNLSNPLEYTRELLAPLCKEKLDEMILECKDCKTCSNCNKKITIGNPNANYLIINDNATDNEEINDYLKDIIKVAEIPEDDVFIINSISCVLKKTFGDETIIRLPTRSEAINCKHFVDYAIKFVNPRVIICMGATSLAMYRNDISVEDVKGKFINIDGYKAIVTHSVKDLFAFTEYYSESQVDEITESVLNDVLKAKSYIDTLRKE